MNRWVVAGGADIGDYAFIRSLLREEDHFIYCDSGLKHLEGLCRTPDLIVGDFDSHENPHMDCETIVLPREKDDTDTSYAVKEAMKRGADEILLIGAAGLRQDHTLVNIYLLFLMDSAGVKGYLADDYSVMEVVSDQVAHIEETYSYFSLLNMTGTARGVTIRGAKFPLENGTITTDDQYATSNEVLPGQTAEVTVLEGRLLLLKIR